MFRPLRLLFVTLALATTPAFALRVPAKAHTATSTAHHTKKSTAARAVPAIDPLVKSAWAGTTYPKLDAIGRGKAVIYSPDLATPDNRAVYERLGFAYFEDSDWDVVLDGILEWNRWHRDAPIRTVVLETHGTNGNGLKLQKSYDPSAPRSYCSIGGLQERLEHAGVDYAILGSCNSGRLFRPDILMRLDRTVNDKLFLPATEGFVEASEDFDPSATHMVILRRADSHLETTSEIRIRELSPTARAAFGAPSPKSFYVSDILIQLVLGDPKLRLEIGGPTEVLSRADHSEAETESLVQRFIKVVNATAWRESGKSGAEPSPHRAKKPAGVKTASKKTPHLSGGTLSGSQ